eukprot:COSAG01_NODE_9459_length_2440_cov_14.780956_1_plen_64_part_00
MSLPTGALQVRKHPTAMQHSAAAAVAAVARTDNSVRGNGQQKSDRDHAAHARIATFPHRNTAR